MAADWTRDEIILACDLISKNDWRGMRASEQPVQDLSRLLREAPIHPVENRDDVFRSPSSVQRKTFDIATQHPNYSGKQTKGNRLDRIILLDFLLEPDRMRDIARAVRAAAGTRSLGRSLLELRDWDIEGNEGSLLVTQHLVRERDPRLRRAKLQVVARGGKPPSCEVCAFDFARAYGAIGEGYVEVHHRLPLHASGPRTTRLSDLALLCSNCHRMMHRSKKWLTVDQLRRLFVAAAVAT